MVCRKNGRNMDEGAAGWSVLKVISCSLAETLGRISAGEIVREYVRHFESIDGRLIVVYTPGIYFVRGKR